MSSVNDFCRNNELNKNRESMFELQFTVGNKFYAYGFSSILNKRIIAEEWLYELMQDGGAHLLFIRKNGDLPILGDGIKLNSEEKHRFKVYSEDFAALDTRLFLTEMNRAKKYSDHSKLLFFKETFDWIMNNMIVIAPYMGISSTEAFYNDESLENIAEIIRTFDTGVSDMKMQQITVKEMNEMVPKDVMQKIFTELNSQMNLLQNAGIQKTWRLDNGFFNIRVRDNSEPEISTLVLKHGDSAFTFNYAEESDGTKRLFHLVDMLLTNRVDATFIVDEFERSLHPKLTEHFLKLFIEAHKEDHIQLILTTHEDVIMNQSLFRRDEIWFTERDAENASTLYSLDRFKERYDKKLSKAYLDGRYGAIPVFQQFSFQKGETNADTHLYKLE